MVAFKRFLQDGAHQVGDAFGNFQSYISYETIGHDYIDVTVEQVAAFDVAHKV